MLRTHVMPVQFPKKKEDREKQFELFHLLMEESARIYRWCSLLNDRLFEQHNVWVEDNQLAKMLRRIHSGSSFLLKAQRGKGSVEITIPSLLDLLYEGASLAHERCPAKKRWKRKSFEEVWEWTSQPLKHSPSRLIDWVADSFCASQKGTRTKRKQGDKQARYQRPSAFFLHRRTTAWDTQSMSLCEDRSCVLSLSALYAPNRKEDLSQLRPTLRIPRQIKSVSKDGLPRIIRLVYSKEKKRYEWHLTYEDGQVKPEPRGSLVASIDPGEIHPFTMMTSDGEALVFSCRELRSTHQKRNKSLASLSSKLSRCTKGSRRWKKLERAKTRVLRACDTKIKDISHKLTAKAAKVCHARGVEKVFHGDVRNISNGKRLHRRAQQKISNWNHGKLRSLLAYKLERFGISMELTNEAYTSRTCPRCGAKHKPRNRNYKCGSCGFVGHRDAVGAANILSRAMHGEIGKVQPPKKVSFLQVYSVRKQKVSQSSLGGALDLGLDQEKERSYRRGAEAEQVEAKSLGSVPCALGSQGSMAGTKARETEVGSSMSPTKPLERTEESSPLKKQTFAQRKTASLSVTSTSQQPSTVPFRCQKKKVRASGHQLSLFSMAYSGHPCNDKEP